MNDTTKMAATEGREIATTRIFAATRELVWEVWTDPKHLAKWWGPNGFTITTKEYDLRVGGKWLFTMHGPDGTDYRNDITYTEVIEPEKIAYDHGPSPIFNVMVLFEAENETHTKLSFRMVFPTMEERDRTVEKFGAIEGLNQTMGRLDEYLAILN
jgi:uncharacterized protein YndB with AHSA1/START domain